MKGSLESKRFIGSAKDFNDIFPQGYMICADCARTRSRGTAWNTSSLGNWSDTCSFCGKTRSLREVVCSKR